MTQQEFTKRTLVEVSNSEFDMINEFYMNCECDKDEFCKMWVKMNPIRVEKAKIEKRMKAREEAYRDALNKFYNKTATYGNSYNDQFTTQICYVKISTYELRALAFAEISVANESGHCKYLSDIRYEIGKFLGKF